MPGRGPWQPGRGGCVTVITEQASCNPCFTNRRPGIQPVMDLSLLLIVIGIIVAVLVNSAVGLACILIGLVLLLWPRLRTL